MIRDYRPAKKRATIAGISILALTAVLLLPSAFAAGKPDKSVPPQPEATPKAAASLEPAERSANEPGDEGSPRLELILPGAGKMSSPFGYRIHPVTGKKTLHDGIDISGKKGIPVTSAAAGQVVRAGYDKIKGNHATIAHDDAWQTEYRHLDKLNVREGDKVKTGGVIGTMGSTGNATGPHLHYSVLRNGEYVNPVPVTTIGFERINDE